MQKETRISINVTFPADLLAQIDRRVAVLKTRRGEYLRSLALKNIGTCTEGLFGALRVRTHPERTLS